MTNSKLVYAYEVTNRRNKVTLTHGWPLKTATALPDLNANWEATIHRILRRHKLPPKTEVPPLFLHVRFHPSDPKRAEIQQIFQKTLLCPDPYALHLSELRNQNDTPFGVRRLQIAFHCPNNLANEVAPNRFTSPTSISQFLPGHTDTTALASGAGSPTAATTNAATLRLLRPATLPPPMAAPRLPSATAPSNTCHALRTPDF